MSFTAAQEAALAEASRVEPGFFHEFLARPMPRHVMLGGVELDFTHH